MRIALLGFGSRGDVWPHLAVALQLETRGHSVVMTADSGHTEIVESCGVETRDVGFDSREMLDSEQAREFLAHGSTIRFLKGARSLDTEKRESLIDALISASDGADVVVTGPLTFLAATCIVERSGQPIFSLLSQPQLRTSEYQSYLVKTNLPTPWLRLASHIVLERLVLMSDRQAIRDIRKRLGLSPDLPSDLISRHSRAGTPVDTMVSPVLFPKPHDWPSYARVVGAPVMSPDMRAAWGEDRHGAALRAWIDEDGPPIYFGFGSMPVLDAAEAIGMISKVSREVGLRGLVGAGWSKFREGESEDGRLFVAPAFDHDRVLPRCRAAVHHGGSGTTHTVARSGLPAVVAHVFGDQVFWGKRVEALGIGVQMPFQKLDENRLRDGVARVLRPEYGERARQIADAMQGENGAVLVADRVESLVAAH